MQRNNEPDQLKVWFVIQSSVIEICDYGLQSCLVQFGYFCVVEHHECENESTKAKVGKLEKKVKLKEEKIELVMVKIREADERN